MSLHIVILAAGRGSRMHSTKAKALQLLANKPLLGHVIETAKKLLPEKLHIIVGHKAQNIKDFFSTEKVNWITQSEQLGTGHALKMALPFLEDAENVMVLSADVPLISVTTLEKLAQNKPTIITAKVAKPFGLGRIVRNTRDEITAIVEEKDASAQQRLITEIYSGICCIPAKYLMQWLPILSNDNKQHEYYLTEIFKFAAQQKITIASINPGDEYEIMGVNNRLELHDLQKIWQINYAKELMKQGVTISDINTFYIRGELVCENDVFIDSSVIFEGHNYIGKHSQIGANCNLKNAKIGENSIIHPNTVIENAEIGSFCNIGPFARIREKTYIANNCKIGNFVETKKTSFDINSKANHLSYLGDAKIGKNVNIGAGTITCNYDGYNKHTTVIKDNAFIGSATQLVAPVTIGNAATIGAGSTIRKDAPDNKLTLSYKTQKTIDSWQRKIKS